MFLAEKGFHCDYIHQSSQTNITKGLKKYVKPISCFKMNG